MNAPSTAMILAAGLGTRMRELTADRPKPMLPVAGRPLLDHALDRAAEGGAARAVVNVHYFAEQIRAHLSGRKAPAVTISDETDALLETGGGLVRALPLLGDAPVYVMNSDALWTGPAPLPVLAEAWDETRMDALLLMVAKENARAYTRAGDFFLTADMRPERRGDRPEAPYVYTGAQILSPALIAEFEEERFSANAIWDRALGRGRLFACVHAGGWVDVGTPEGLQEADRLVREDEA
ncbi:nucleotidyltransferase family protein [Rhodovulum sp. DZ06]|uniref:nucleotidyltransferase family protein n=1 Tax=Rhodovulum sp. DZ06 TaxID=3425126 RepID=UPI003D351095